VNSHPEYQWRWVLLQVENMLKGKMIEHLQQNYAEDDVLSRVQFEV